MTVKDIVEDLLRKYPEARNSDSDLYYYFFKDYLDIPLKPYHKKQLEDTYSLESLRRARQVIQNTEDRLKPKDQVKKARLEKEKEISKDLSVLIGRA